MSNNRSLMGLNWQEQHDGSWYAETAHYKTIVYELSEQEKPKPGTLFFGHDWMPLVYEWNETEQAWLIVHKGFLGSDGGAEGAKVDAESALGEYIQKKTRKENDPKAELTDALEKLARSMLADRLDRSMQFPSNHPPVRGRDDSFSSPFSDLFRRPPTFPPDR